MLGGTQSLHTNSYDETYALPTEEAGDARAAHPAGHREETGVAAVADPLAGSYFVEALTNEMERRAWRTSNGSTPWAASNVPSTPASSPARSGTRAGNSSAMSTRGGAWS